MISSIIDVPRKHDQEDLFGIKVYQNALVKYIQHTETPITIALQGEWGSGKTSLMNLLRWNLCDKDGAEFFPIWINTWQYSLMKTPKQAIFSILDGIINQIGALNPEKQNWEASKKKIGGIFKRIATVGTKVAAGAVGVDGGLVDELLDGGSPEAESDIVQLKNEISNLIDKALAEGPDKKGFTFYIDDLDRIDPPVAVEILELLKNIFDLDKCIFILAIDYDVVIKGLKPKFGELTDQNEREFRSFFDKIIQLPFSMPVASYNVDSFLVDALRKIEFFTESELANSELAASLSRIATLSVGTNPRSLKRLSNTLSLISIINQTQGLEESNDSSKVLNFALVCIQIAYPYIYNQLTEAPDFKQWDDSVASRLKLRPLTEEEKGVLDSTEEFDDPWEKVLFRMCQKETHLSNRSFQVSNLLNEIASLVNNDEMLGSIIESTLELSAVTNLKAFDTPKKVSGFDFESIWKKVVPQFKGKSKTTDRAYLLVKSKHKVGQHAFIISDRRKEILITFETYARKTNGGEFQEGLTHDDELKERLAHAMEASGNPYFSNLVFEQGSKRKDKWAAVLKLSYAGREDQLVNIMVENMNKSYESFEALNF